MSYSISDCENFLELDGMKFMAFEETYTTRPCDGCYFLNVESECEWNDNMNARLCITPRNDNRSIIWLRTE